MITVIEGLTGSGKTWLMTRLIKKRWSKGEKVYPNFPLWFDDAGTDVIRWHNLDECYDLREGILVIDESQKFLDARRWQMLPMAFTEKIAMHRHHHLDIFTTTQDIGHIDIRLRSNIHMLYRCKSIFRFPRRESSKPILQIIVVKKMVRQFQEESQRIRFVQSGMAIPKFISKYWTKTFYNTYGDVGGDQFLCKINYNQKASQKKGEWQVRVVSRELVERGKKRF